ncbi:MAG: hypothetical protein O3B74_03350 [Proteobacteria bacterium]|nr:hypothetical protein [Pseudomonadota bacterium]
MTTVQANPSETGSQTSHQTAIDAAVRNGQLLMFQRNQPLTLVSNLVIAPVYGLAVWQGVVGLDVFWWVGAIYFITAIRIGIYLRLRGAGGAQGWPAWALKSFVGGSLAAGLVWGIGVMMFTDTADPFAVGISSFFVAGMISGATAALSPLMPAFICFAAPFVLAFALVVLDDGGDAQVAMAVSLFVYACGMFWVTSKLNRQISQMLTLRWTNSSLVAEVIAEKDRAETASRVKSDFLARMSHELRTPLNSIIGFSETIATGRFRDKGLDKYEEFAAEIHDSGRHLLDLIDDILDIAKIEAGRLELEDQNVDLADAIDFAISVQVTHAQAQGVSVTAIDVDPGLVMRVN